MLYTEYCYLAIFLVATAAEPLAADSRIHVACFRVIGLGILIVPASNLKGILQVFRNLDHQTIHKPIRLVDQEDL